MPAKCPPDCRAVDHWLQLSLVERYSTTLRDPLPDSLLRLLDGLKP